MTRLPEEEYLLTTAMTYGGAEVAMVKKMIFLKTQKLAKHHINVKVNYVTKKEVMGLMSSTFYWQDGPASLRAQSVLPLRTCSSPAQPDTVSIRAWAGRF